MGKRSDFEPIPRDFYPTPYAAVPPLIPHLRGVRRFAEPCCGDGALVRHLESFGLCCVYAGDIATGQDALDLTPADINGAPIITNTPFSRESQPLLRRLIAHFSRITSMTWLLLPADFASNQWFARFLPQCSDIVPIGRVRWIAGTTMSSMENFAWYRFDSHHVAGPILHARDSAPVSSRVTLCAQCAAPYRPQRSDSRFCSDTCRQRAHRTRLAVTRCDARPTNLDKPSTPTIELRYVPHPDVESYEAQGWQRTAALDGTHHGEHAVLMLRPVNRQVDGGT